MNEEILLDILYNQKFDSKYMELEVSTIQKLDEKSNYVLHYKIEKILEEIKEQFIKTTSVIKSATEYLPDLYTNYLLETHFDQHITEFLENPIASYMDKYLDVIKNKYKDNILQIPQNIQLNKEQTVKLIASYKALKLFQKRLGSITKNDDLEIVLKKISKEGFKAPVVIIESEIEFYALIGGESEQAKKFKSEFTITRQVLAIHYLFKFAGISSIQYDKTKLAEFIRFLTGRELGADKISNTTIYKKVNNPFKDKDFEKIEDLKYVRKFFSDMNLGGIVDLINNEIEN